MKRISIILIIAMLFTLLAACDNSTSGSEIGLLKDGVLQVGVEIGYPPFEMYADDGVTPIGFDIDLAKAIAEYLEIDVEFIDTSWDGIFSGLSIDKYDVVISAVTITGDRKETMDFSKPYITNWQSIVVLKGNDPITSIAGLEGLNVGFQGQTTSDEYLDNMIATGVVNCSPQSYEKVMYCFDDLKNGRIDAAIVDSVVSEGYVAREPDVFEITWHQQDVAGEEPELFGVAVKKGNTALKEAIDEVIEALESNGTLNDLRDTWLS